MKPKSFRFQFISLMFFLVLQCYAVEQPERIMPTQPTLPFSTIQPEEENYVFLLPEPFGRVQISYLGYKPLEATRGGIQIKFANKTYHLAPELVGRLLLVEKPSVTIDNDQGLKINNFKIGIFYGVADLKCSNPSVSLRVKFDGVSEVNYRDGCYK